MVRAPFEIRLRACPRWWVRSEPTIAQLELMQKRGVDLLITIAVPIRATHLAAPASCSSDRREPSLNVAKRAGHNEPAASHLMFVVAMASLKSLPLRQAKIRQHDVQNNNRVSRDQTTFSSNLKICLYKNQLLPAL